MTGLITRRYGQLKWFIKEMVKTFSNEPSYFSSKRWERWISFMTGETFLVTYFCYHFKVMTYLECLALAGAAFAVAGISLNATQKEKKLIEKPSADTV